MVGPSLALDRTTLIAGGPASHRRNFHVEFMMSENSNQAGEGSSRRTFLKSTTALVGGAVLGGVGAQVARGAHPGGSDEIKVALIGCGGRGTGAASQALATKGKVTLWAAADAFEDNLQTCLKNVKREVERGQRDDDPLYKDAAVDVPPERQFVGFNAYQQALDSGADLVV